MVLAEMRLSEAERGWNLRASMRRQLLAQIGSIMLPDAASLRIARQMGLDADRIAMTGPVSEIRQPLSCSETERVSMAQQMNGRHAWFAACVPSGPFALAGCSASPGFDFADFDMGARAALLDQYPDLHDEILRFT